jgi:hypothetical protein
VGKQKTPNAQRRTLNKVVRPRGMKEEADICNARLVSPINDGESGRDYLRRYRAQ